MQTRQYIIREHPILPDSFFSVVMLFKVTKVSHSSACITINENVKYDTLVSPKQGWKVRTVIKCMPTLSKGRQIGFK